MSKIQDQVVAFHKAFDQPIAESPCIPGKDRVRLRAALIIEEAIEFLEALYGRTSDFEMAKSIIENVLLRREPRVDLAKAADALGDLDYVVEGSRLEFGIDGESVADEIQRSNMAKVGGPVSATGKRLKPVGWQEPDIEGVLDRQSRGELPSVGLRLKGRVHYQPDPNDTFVCFAPEKSPFRIGWASDSFTDKFAQVTCRHCLADLLPEPDANCVTTLDGRCIGTAGCMHDLPTKTEKGT